MNPARPLAMALALLTAACTSQPATRAPAAAGTAAAEDSAVRQAASDFVSCLNALDFEHAADLIAWDAHVARDERLRGLVEQLKSRYRRKPDRRYLDRPVFEDSSVTRREVMRSPDPAALFARIARERFVTESRRAFGPQDRSTVAEVLRLESDPGHIQATLRMPDGRLSEFLIIWQAGRWLLLPF